MLFQAAGLQCVPSLHARPSGTNARHVILFANVLQPVQCVSRNGLGLRFSADVPVLINHFREQTTRGSLVPPVRMTKTSSHRPDPFISFDIDVLDPAFVPGTGTPVPGGLTPREAFPLVRRLCAESNVVGYELVELNPLVDPTYVSAMNANRIVRECLTGMAMRKTGLTDKHYLSPKTVDDGRK